MASRPLTSRKTSLILRRALRGSRISQIALIAVFWLLGEVFVRVSGLPIPGSVVGMIALVGLLATGAIQLASMRRGANMLLADMLLFFVPAVLAVLDHGEFLGIIGLKILAVIVIGTLVVMCTTALAVDAGFRVMQSMERRRALR
jgi:holin-like protein